MRSNICWAGHQLAEYGTDTTCDQIGIREVAYADGCVESLVYNVDEMIAEGGLKLQKWMLFCQVGE